MMVTNGWPRSIGHGCNMSIIYTVRLNGKPIKNFLSKEQAENYMRWLMNIQQAEALREKYIEEAVTKSDLKEANEVIAYIKDLPNKHLTS